MKQPKIRMKGFDGEWNGVKFYETFEPLKNNALSRAELSDCGEVKNIHYGDVLIKYGACVNVSKDIDTYVKDNEFGLKLHQACPIKSGDVIFADAAEDNTVGKCTEVVAENEEKIISGLHTIACRPKYSFAPYFLGYYLNSCAYHDQLIPLMQGTKVSSLSKRAFGQTIIFLPSLPEQTAIAKYFTALDGLIQATAKELEKLRTVKAASLQSLFPQEGETVPKIRFKGFEGEWKEKPFYETFENLKNNALSRAELSNCGKVRNIHYGDVLIKYGACVNVSKDVDTYVKDNELGLKLHQACPLKSGDVIFADAAEDNTVGKCSEVVAENEEKIVSGLHTIACRPIFIFVPYFLGYYLNSCAYHNQLIPLIQGTKVSSLSKRAFGQTKIVYPSLPEQTAIANYFTALDERIQATAKRLEKLRNIKAACLDNMFV